MEQGDKTDRRRLEPGQGLWSDTFQWCVNQSRLIPLPIEAVTADKTTRASDRTSTRRKHELLLSCGRVTAHYVEPVLENQVLVYSSTSRNKLLSQLSC